MRRRRHLCPRRGHARCSSPSDRQIPRGTNQKGSERLTGPSCGRYNLHARGKSPSRGSGAVALYCVFAVGGSCWSAPPRVRLWSCLLLARDRPRSASCCTLSFFLALAQALTSGLPPTSPSTTARMTPTRRENSAVGAVTPFTLWPLLFGHRCDITRAIELGCTKTPSWVRGTLFTLWPFPFGHRCDVTGAIDLGWTKTPSWVRGTLSTLWPFPFGHRCDITRAIELG